MTRDAKILLVICGLIILAPVAYFIFFMGAFIYGADMKQKAGKDYMDSMTEKDFQIWTQRTQKYLDEFDPKAYTIGSKPVPPELRQLKILRIDEQPNEVDYVWMGGMDHTELEVERMTNGIYQFTAVYNDDSNRVIWPKQ